MRACSLLGSFVIEDSRCRGKAAFDFLEADTQAVLDRLGSRRHYWTRPRGVSRTTELAGARVEANVDALNQLGRQAFAERCWLTGPEITAPGGRRYRTGDRIVALSPSAGVVTSEAGTVEGVDLRISALVVRLDDGRTTVLPRPLTSSNRLAHGYAITVHRSQGATVDTAHYLEDGGGRELAYVALSRARQGCAV